MFEELVKAFAFVLEAYVIAGFVFAGAFVLTGVQRVDSEARGSRITFRLLIAPGVDFVGPFPAEVQQELVFTAAASADTKDIDGAKALIAFLKSAGAAAVIKAKGMEPIAR